MFSDHFFKNQIFWTNKIAAPVGASPFKIDKNRRRFYTSARIRQRCFRVLFSLVCQNMFLLVAMLLAYKRGDTDGFNQLYLGWVLSTLWCICLGAGVFKAQLLVYTCNCYMIFFERYTDMFMPGYNPNTCRMNRLVDCICGVVRQSCTVLAILQVAFGFVNSRKSPFYIDYYIPDEYYVTWVYLGCVQLHIIISIVTSIIFGISFTFVFATCVHMSAIISQDLLCCRTGSYRTLDTLRTGSHLRTAYKSLEILMQLQTEISGIVLYPLNWFMLKMVVVCGATLIKYHDKMTPLVRNLMMGWGLTGLILWGLILEVCGYMAQYSQRAIASWKHHDWESETKIMSKFRKSCRPIKVAYHKLFSIKRISVLKFFKSVAKSLFKAIVSL